MKEREGKVLHQDGASRKVTKLFSGGGDKLRLRPFHPINAAPRALGEQNKDGLIKSESTRTAHGEEPEHAKRTAQPRRPPREALPRGPGWFRLCGKKKIGKQTKVARSVSRANLFRLIPGPCATTSACLAPASGQALRTDSAAIVGGGGLGATGGMRWCASAGTV